MIHTTTLRLTGEAADRFHLESVALAGTALMVAQDQPQKAVALLLKAAVEIEKMQRSGQAGATT